MKIYFNENGCRFDSNTGKLLMIDDLSGTTTTTTLPPTTTTTTTSSVLPNPLLFYDFSNSSGSTVWDYSGNDISGQTFGTTSYLVVNESGKTFNSVKLETDGYVHVSSGILQYMSAYTISFWTYNVNLSQYWARYFDFGYDTSHYMFLPVMVGTPRFTISINGEQVLASNITITNLGPHHIVITHSDGGNTTTYIDNAQASQTSSITHSATSLTPDVLNYIGKSQYADPTLNGQIGLFKIFTEEFAPSQVEILYNEPNN